MSVSVYSVRPSEGAGGKKREGTAGTASWRDTEPHDVKNEIKYDASLPPPHTTTHQVGTPLYMAAEVLRGDGYAWESDLWSLGCLLYELAQLRSPFKPPPPPPQEEEEGPELQQQGQGQQGGGGGGGAALYALFQRISLVRRATSRC